MKKVLFIYQGLQSFVEKDLNVLREKFDVKEVHFKGSRNVMDLWRGAQWADITFSWFGKLHAFWAVLFSKLLRKKSIVVAGGDDVACVPEIGYGMFSFWWKKWCPLFVFRYADLVLSVSKFNEKETLLNTKADPKRTKMVYHGFSADFFKKMPNVKKENIVITIGSVSKETEIKKGLRLFIDSAKFLPDTQFLLIGPDKDGTLQELKGISSKNVEFLGGIYGKELVDLCSKSKVYVQVSVHESFGCSLAEAMLCECIPVVSRNAAIPEVVGDTGGYVDKLTPEDVAEKIKYALNMPDDYGKRARNLVIEKFPINKRKWQLLESIRGVCDE